MRGKMSAAGEMEFPSHTDATPTPMEDIPELPEYVDRYFASRWKHRLMHCVGTVTPITILDVIRQHSPRAFDYLMLNDVVASGIAVQQHWLRDKRTIPTQEERDAVTATVEAYLAVHGKAATKATPTSAPLSTPTLRQLHALREEYRRSKIQGWELRVADLDARIAQMEETPWKPAGL
jgi:hypothetical protein